MIDEFGVKNFKSWEDVVVKLDHGVNIFHGLSTTGKTALIRGLCLLFENRPLGGRYFSDFAGDSGETKIYSKFTDGNIVSLTKKIKVDKETKTVVEGKYKINDNIEFAAPKEGLPDQVAEIFNLSELNIQRQFDQPFLVMSSGGEIARTINRITKLEKVTEWVASFNSIINSNNKEVKRIELETKNDLEQLKKYENIDDSEKIINELINVDSDILILENRIKSLNNFLLTYENTQCELSKIQDLLGVEKYITKIDSITKEIDLGNSLNTLITLFDDSIEQINNIKTMCLALTELTNNLNETIYSDLLKKYENNELLLNKYFDLESDLLKISTCLGAEKYFEKIEAIQTEILNFEKFSNVLKNYDIFNKEYVFIVDEYNESKDEYLSILKKTGKCPTCFANMDEKHLRQIEIEL